MTDFLASMPAAYARAFDPTDIAEHAHIVSRRGNRLVYAELCCEGSGRALCLVADDRPGLLSLVTEALLVHALGVDRAEAYVRRRADGQDEAVELLHLNQSLDIPELAAFLQTLSELLAEDIRVSALKPPPPRPAEPTRRVYFDLDALRRDEYVLVVEAPDSDGLLHAITSTLHALGLPISACQISTESGLARDRFELRSAEGARLGAAELCDVQLAVVDALPRGPSHGPAFFE